MISYEELSEQLPSKAVIDAVESSNSGNVIASDVAALAGVSLSQARKELTVLASLSRGDIAVSSEGELIYSLPSNLSSVLSSNSLKFRALATLQKIWPPLFYAIRVSFGVALLVSIFVIFSTIALIQSSSSSDDRDRGDRRGGGGMRGGGFGGSFFWGPSPLDLFYYRPYYGYYGTPRNTAGYKDPEEMGFLESTFSYIFGDGNPNQDIEERRLQLVSNVIRENGGAVTAEQLAPFVLEIFNRPDDDVDDVDSTRYVDESFVLPIVSQLGGEPQVTEEGDIVYLFPELLQTGSTSSPTNMLLEQAGLPSDASPGAIRAALIARGVPSSKFTRGMEKSELMDIFQQSQSLFQNNNNYDDDTTLDDKQVLQEQEYEFSVATDLNKILAAGLGALNLGGALYLGKLLSSAAMYGVQLPSYYGLVQSGYPLLLGYAILYNVIPLARNFWIKGQNAKIKARNKNRRLWRTKVLASNAAGRIARKLQQAKKMGMRMKRLGSAGDEAVVFDTRMTSQEVEVNQENDSLKEFDRLLGEKDFE